MRKSRFSDEQSRRDRRGVGLESWQNANNESFDGKVRDECLSLEWFRSRAEAKVVIEIWRCHCNAVRPHSSLDYLTPHEYKQQPPSSPDRAVLQE